MISRTGKLRAWSVVSALTCLLALAAMCVVLPERASADIRVADIPAASAAPATASTLSTASTPKNTVTTVSAKERKAYKRALAACYDYENQPNPIVVDMRDLKLTAKEAKNVWSLIHSNGELFWINCYGDTFTKQTFRLPCRYSDKRINAMRVKFEAEVKKALKRAKPGFTQARRVHMLHDYLLDRADYKAKKKTAYTALVQGKADCYGFTLTMDVLLRRAGFSVDVAFNNKLDHSWNLARVGGKWYHIDATWDNGYCGHNYGGNFNWSKKRCHLFLLQSDKSMNNRTTDPVTGNFIRSHSGWTCHHKCTSVKFDFARDYNKGFYQDCRKKM